MDIINFLAYQRKDAEALRIERALSKSAAKQTYTQMLEIVKDAKKRTIELEKMAGDMHAKFCQAKTSLEKNEAHLSAIQAKDTETMSSQETNENFSRIATISSNLNVLEKKLLAIAEEVNSILSKFEKTKKEYGVARSKYNTAKAQYEKEEQQAAPQLAAVAKELEKMEHNLDKNVLAKYKAIRQDKIFPVLVPFDGKCCGGCHMEIPYAEQSRLKADGYIECEHCRRIIYR